MNAPLTSDDRELPYAQPADRPAVTAASSNASRFGARVVVVGAGPVGLHFAREFARRRVNARVILYGGETRLPYDRVSLSSYLAGELSDTAIRLPGVDDARVEQRLGQRVERVDRDGRCVQTATGDTIGFDYLVIATGSRPHRPGIRGLDLPGVFTFRDLDDAEALAARRLRSRHTVIIGGGLLGLEAARAMRRFNTRITIVEHTPRLMFNQLDDAGAALLERAVRDQHINVLTGSRVRAVGGRDAVETVTLGDGRVLACDTVIVAAGIVPNIELARDCGLRVGRGIVVDDFLRTNDPRILAIGECAEHRGIVYGLVRPGLEQASVAAGAICGERVRYAGSAAATRLKVMSVPVFSSGDVIDSVRPIETLSFGGDDDRYRMLNIDRGRLVGACAVGDWPDNARLEELVQRHGFLWPWQRRRFVRSGSPWPEDAIGSAAAWPANAVICNCTGVTRGDIARTVRAGAADAGAIAATTRASTVCGSCRPLLEQIAGQDAHPLATPWWRSIAVISLLTGIAAIAFALLPGAGYSPTVHDAWGRNQLWYHTPQKEWTGYGLLGLAAVASLLSLRKRLPEVRWLSFPAWRALHVVLGCVLVALLFLHTGFRAGEHLNAWLMSGFMLALASGALIGGVVAAEHRLQARTARTLRSASVWLHVGVLWPLPVLLGFHVLKTYYF